MAIVFTGHEFADGGEFITQSLKHQNIKVSFFFTGDFYRTASFKPIIQQLKKEFWSDVRIPGEINGMNPELDKAGRVADFIELGELMCKDALNRNESCGGHFREESQTEDGEAKRDDDNYSYVSAWEYKGESDWQMNTEPLTFEIVKPTQRSYK